jgi:FkbM family methyltransferase
MLSFNGQPSLYEYVKKVINIKVKKGKANFYGSIFRSMIRYLITHEIINPANYMKSFAIVKYDDWIFFVDKNTSFGYYLLLNLLEPYTYSEIMENKGDLFIDVGANAGGYTIRAAKKYKKVISIEPNPVYIQIIRNNITLNSLHNIIILGVALSNFIGTSKFYTSNLGQLSSLTNFEGSKDVIEVKVTTLEEVIDNLGQIPDLIKIDAEGEEVNVIEGLGKYTAKITKLIVEISSKEKLGVIRNILGESFREQRAGNENFIFIRRLN